MALEKELALYKELKPALLRDHRGEWVLISGTEFDTWHCYSDAIKIGYQKYGLNSFLVKRILEDETQRFYLGMAGKVLEGFLIPESVSLLDKPIDPRCYVDLPMNIGIEKFNVLDHPKTEAL